MTQLPQEIADLSASEKLELLDALWESIESGVASLTQDQEEELAPRLARYQQDPTNVIPWEAVKAHAFRKS